MGHRHLFSPSYMIEAENDQSWNLTEHPYIHNTRNVSSETTSIIYPDNMSIDGAQYTHCNHTSYSSLPNNLQIPDYQQNSAGPSDLPMHTPYINIPPGDYRNQASSSSSSSNYNGNPFNEDLFDIRMGSNNNNNNNNSNNNNNNSNTRGHGHGHYKRKSPGVPDVATTNGTSSADVTMLTEQQQQQQPWQEPPSINFLHAPWDYNNNTTTPDHHHHHNHHHHHHHHHHHRSNSSLLIGESSRNVRSRGMFDLEANSSRTQLTNNLSRDYFTTSRPMDVSPSLDLNAWNPTTHDSNSLNCEMNPFLEGNSNPSSSSLEIGQQQQQQNNNLVTRNNHVLQNFHATSLQSVRGVRSNYGQSQSQRLGSTFRVSSTSSNHLRLGHTDEGLQLATNNYSSRNLRPSSSNSLGWHSNSDRSGRVRLSNERYRSFSGVNFHDRSQPEGLVIVDRSAFYGSRNPFDQHRDMRLDIDDMSYEELLALGERIGSVATGLPDPLISKCIQESIYCSSDQIQDEATCVICLEEYANMDDIGMLKACGHDFHVGCIKKWLSLKNMCPICKTEPAKQK